MAESVGLQEKGEDLIRYFRRSGECRGEPLCNRSECVQVLGERKTYLFYQSDVFPECSISESLGFRIELNFVRPLFHRLQQQQDLANPLQYLLVICS